MKSTRPPNYSNILLWLKIEPIFTEQNIFKRNKQQSMWTLNTIFHGQFLIRKQLLLPAVQCTSYSSTWNVQCLYTTLWLCWQKLCILDRQLTLIEMILSGHNVSDSCNDWERRYSHTVSAMWYLITPLL